MRNDIVVDDALAKINLMDDENLNFKFKASDFPKLKEYFENNKIKEKCLYYVLVEDIYDTIKIEIIIKKLAFTSFSFTDIKEFFLELPTHEDNIFMKKGYLKRNKIYYNGQSFIIPEAESKENEYYEVRDLIESIEKSLAI